MFQQIPDGRNFEFQAEIRIQRPLKPYLNIFIFTAILNFGFLSSDS